MNNTKMKTFCSIQSRLQVLSTAITALFLMFVIVANASALHAQTDQDQMFPRDTSEVTLEGKLTMYLYANYGEKRQKIDRYRHTGEGACVAYVLKSDKTIDVTPYLYPEEIGFFSERRAAKQCEFMIVPDWDLYESLSDKEFAEKFANKRVRVTGKMIYPGFGWQNVTPLIMVRSKVEAVGANCGKENKTIKELPVDPMKYFFVFDDDTPERHEYAKKLNRFAEKLQHDKTTFDTDLSKQIDELQITYNVSSDGKLKLYSWHDGDNGSTISFHTIYQTKQNGEFHSVFMEDYYREPEKLYQLESSDGPVYLVEYFFRESGWSYDIGVDAFKMDKTGLLQPAEVFECVRELHDTAVGYSANLSVDYPPEKPSHWQNGAWSDNFFFELTGRDLYMPQYAYLRGSDGPLFMTDYYHRFTWEDNKFRYKQLEFNPVLAKYLPEPGWLLAEFETDDSIVRVDSVANGSYRLLLWNKDKMFSAAPELVITKGWYDAEKKEYHFRKGDNEYVFDAVSQKLQVLRKK